MRSTHALLRPVLVMGLVLFTALVALNPFFGTGEAAASDHILYVNASVVGGAQDGSS